MDKITTIKQSAKSILTGNIESAKNLINKEYPFKKLKPEGRSYTAVSYTHLTLPTNSLV